MESTVQLSLDNILTCVRNYEKHTDQKIVELERTLEAKNDLIDTQNDLNNRLKEEMKDFLKVSYANKWKKQVEETQKQLDDLENKYRETLNTNRMLNKSIEELSDEKTLNEAISKSDAYTQTDTIKIATKKTNYYLVENELQTEDKKIIGSIVI
jgi:capsular polysaccharide biosynthesis protein